MIIKRHHSTQDHPRARHLPTCQSPKNFPGSTAYPPKPMESTLRPLLDQHTPAAVVYSDNTSLHCEPLQPHLSCVSPWIRQCTANSKLVWPWQWSPWIRQCTANSELASYSEKKTQKTYMSCVSPWIRQCTANSKSVWPGHWSTLIRQLLQPQSKHSV